MVNLACQLYRLLNHLENVFIGKDDYKEETHVGRPTMNVGTIISGTQHSTPSRLSECTI